MPDASYETHHHHHHHHHHGEDALPPKPSRAAPKPSALAGVSGMGGESGSEARGVNTAPRPDLGSLSKMAGASGSAIQKDAAQPKTDFSTLSGLGGASGQMLGITGSPELTSLSGFKSGKLQQLVKKTAEMDNPNPEFQESKENKVKTGMSEIDDAHKKAAKEHVIDEIKGLIEDFGGEIGKQILDAIDTVKSIGTTIAKIIKTIKEGGEDKLQQALTLAQQIVKLAGVGNGLMGDIFKEIPIVGTILDAIKLSLSFVENLKNAIDASRAKRRIRKRKELAKQRIMELQGKAPQDMRGTYVTKRRARGSLSKKEGLHFDQRDFGTETKKGSRTRSRRLDEFTKLFHDKEKEKQRRANDPMEELDAVVGVESGDEENFEHDDRADQEEAEIVDMSETTTGVEDQQNREALVAALEDYDIDKELTGANKKREADAIIKIVAENATEAASTLAELDPSVGKAVSSGIEAASKGFKQGRTVARVLRQVGRDEDLHGFNANKSAINKAKRRHTLAVNVFQRVKGLNALDLENVDPGTATPEQVQSILPRYETMDDTITAMGTGYNPLLEAKDADAMVAVMRGGFYRSGGKEDDDDDDD